MSDMMDDINNYAKIWDAALEKGIFKDAPKPPQPSNPTDTGADFFGQNLSSEYDIDRPLNEVDIKYWAKISRMADPNPLHEEKDDAQIKKVNDKVASGHNPLYPGWIGKDQEPRVTQNWGTGGKEHFELEELKIRLEKLESKLNAQESQGQSGKDTRSKIDNIKKQIDDLSDSLSGNRWTNDAD